MDFLLTELQRNWQARARAFADDDIRPISLERDQTADPRETIEWDIIQKGSKLGFRTASVPREFGGYGIDIVAQTLVIAALARGDSAIAKTFSQCWKWAHLIADRGTQTQRERYLGAFLADDAFLLGGGITEPNAGSDNRLPPSDVPQSGLQLRAEREGDVWVLNGGKCYIANANVGKLIFVYARTEPQAPIGEGTTIFAVPSDAPGMRVGKVFNKSGWRFYQNAELFFENVRVPDADRLGAVNGGLKSHGGVYESFSELEYPANALGVCEAALAMAHHCARSVRRGDAPLAAQQLIQLKLSDMHAYTEALRSFVLRLAAEGDGGAHETRHYGHFLVNFSCDAIQRVCEANLDIHSHAGGAADLEGADKLVRDAFIWTHIAGDSVMRMRSMQALLK